MPQETAVTTAPNNVPTRTRALLRVSADFLVEMLKDPDPIHVQVSANGLPADAKVVHIGYDEQNIELFMVLESEVLRADSDQ